MKDYNVFITTRTRRNHINTEKRVYIKRKQIINISEEDYFSYNFIKFILVYVKTLIFLTSSKTNTIINK